MEKKSQARLVITVLRTINASFTQKTTSGVVLLTQALVFVRRRGNAWTPKLWKHGDLHATPAVPTLDNSAHKAPILTYAGASLQTGEKLPAQKWEAGKPTAIKQPTLDFIVYKQVRFPNLPLPNDELRLPITSKYCWLAVFSSDG